MEKSIELILPSLPSTVEGILEREKGMSKFISDNLHYDKIKSIRVSDNITPKSQFGRTFPALQAYGVQINLLEGYLYFCIRPLESNCGAALVYSIAYYLFDSDITYKCIVEASILAAKYLRYGCIIIGIPDDDSKLWTSMSRIVKDKGFVPSLPFRGTRSSNQRRCILHQLVINN